MKIEIPVPDMHCPSCCMQIEALEDTLPGVTRMEASYVHRSVEVEFDETRISAEQIEAAVQTLGYHPGHAGAPHGGVRARLPVTGMSCSSCAGLIETNLAQLPGVARVAVDLAGDAVVVEYEPTRVDLRAIILCIQQIGYGVPLAKLELPLIGLGDPADALTLERLLTRQEGVLAASVASGSEQVFLEFIPGMVSLAELTALVREAGFRLAPTVEGGLSEVAETDWRSRERDHQRLMLILGLVFTTPLILFSMARDFRLVGFAHDQVAMLIPATLVQFLVGGAFYRGAWKSLRAGGANMDVLIVLGSSVAYFSSLGVTLGLIPGPHVYFETGAAIITLIRLGKFLETRAKGRTSEALRTLMGLRPSTAQVLRDGVEIQLPLEQVQVGDQVMVRPGEKVPVDGLIRQGCSAIDESMITGESMPISKGPGDEVIGATLNRDGFITLEATRVGVRTTLARIVHLVQEAQAAKAPIQKLTDEIGRTFVPIVLCLALLTFLGWIAVVFFLLFAAKRLRALRTEPPAVVAAIIFQVGFIAQFIFLMCYF